MSRESELVGTHVPVLLALARVLSIRSVLELGSGLISTPTFLDRRVFPQLERLDSWENQATWWHRVKDYVASDSRASVQYREGWLGPMVEHLDLTPYDLVFIDDGGDLLERSATIRSVVGRLPARAVVAVHDFENEAYQRALVLPHVFEFAALVPRTGVGWRDALVSVPQLHTYDAKIRGVWLAAMDVDSWLARL